jgi:hypothetical protein
MAKDQIGAVILKNTSLSEGQLNEVMALQTRQGQRLGDVLGQLASSNADDILKIFARTWVWIS